MKKILVVVGTLVVLAGIAVAVYAAYDVSGSSSPENFAAGTATNLVPDPAEGDLAGILPGQTKSVNVSVYNSNPVAVTVTAVDLSFAQGALCALSSTAWSGSYVLGAGSTAGWVIAAAMGNPDPSCNGATLQVSAVANGTMP